MARLAATGVHPVAQIDYWQDNGGVTYQDPDEREVVPASCVYSAVSARGLTWPNWRASARSVWPNALAGVQGCLGPTSVQPVRQCHI
jgi:hypothetical protein